MPPSVFCLLFFSRLLSDLHVVPQIGRWRPPRFREGCPFCTRPVYRNLELAFLRLSKIFGLFDGVYIYFVALVVLTPSPPLTHQGEDATRVKLCWLDDYLNEVGYFETTDL